MSFNNDHSVDFDENTVTVTNDETEKETVFLFKALKFVHEPVSNVLVDEDSQKTDNDVPSVSTLIEMIDRFSPEYWMDALSEYSKSTNETVESANVTEEEKNVLRVLFEIYLRKFGVLEKTVEPSDEETSAFVGNFLKIKPIGEDSKLVDAFFDRCYAF